MTEHRVDAEKNRMQKFLNHENLVLVQEREVGVTGKIAPEKLGKDYATVFFWSWS
jgi:hypothetical protein